MDNKYQHPSIQLFIMSSKPTEENAETMSRDVDQQIDEVGASENKHGEEDRDSDNSCCTGGLDDSVGSKATEANIRIPSGQNGKLNEWEARRIGSMAARLLRDVRIT